MHKEITIFNETILPGKSKTINMQIGKLHTMTDLHIPIIVEIPHIESEDKMVKNQDRSTLSEAFRMLRTNLSFLLNKTMNF